MNQDIRQFDAINVYDCRDSNMNGWRLCVDHGVAMKVDGNWVEVWSPDFSRKWNTNPLITERMPINAKRVKITKAGELNQKQIDAIKSAGFKL